MHIKAARFLAVLAARNKEFWRDRAALAWSFLFPIAVVIGFAFAFSGDRLELYKVGVLSGDASTAQQFLGTRYVQFIPINDADADRRAAIAKVERHQLDLLIEPAAHRYWVNDTSPRGYMLERMLRGATSVPYTKQAVTGREIRYVDWLIPGLLSMNMMFSALFGVGYVIVRYRKNGVLRRLRATPVTAFEFLAAQVVSRLWLILGITAIVYVGSDLVVGFSMFGSYLDLLILFTLGSVTMISLALLVAARVSSEELAGGLLNMITWPMMFLSGVWFSLEGLNPYIRDIAQLLPLTHLIEGARAIMLDGAHLSDISGDVITLAVMSVVFLALGAYTFRWE